MGSSSSNATYPRNRRDRLLAKQVCCCCGVAHRALELAGNVRVGQHVFVDPVNGNDATGLRERLDRPFQTLLAGLRAAQDGDTVALQPGTYTTATPIDLATITAANLVVQGWGNSQNVILDGATGLFTWTTGAPTHDDWKFEGMTLRTTTGNAFTIGNPSTAYFTGDQGLVIRDVVVDSSEMSFTRLGRLTLDSVNEHSNPADFSDVTIVGVSDLRVSNSNFFDMSLDYAFATAAAPRRGYAFYNVWITRNLNLTGPISAAFDASTRAGNINATTPPDATNELNPVIRFAGTVGLEPAGWTANVTSPGLSTVSVDFGTTAWYTAAPTDEMAGVDFSGARLYATLDITFGYDLAADGALDTNQFFFGGDHVSILGDLTVTGAGTLDTDLDYVKFRNSTIGVGENAGSILTVTSTSVDLDLRGSVLSNATLNAATPGVGGIDRDRENLGTGTTVPVGPVFSVTLSYERFPSYVAGVFPTITPSLGEIASFSSAATLTDVTVETSVDDVEVNVMIHTYASYAPP